MAKYCEAAKRKFWFLVLCAICAVWGDELVGKLASKILIRCKTCTICVVWGNELVLVGKLASLLTL